MQGPLFIEQLLQALIDADDEKGRNAVWFMIAAIGTHCDASEVISVSNPQLLGFPLETTIVLVFTGRVHRLCFGLKGR